MRKTTPLRRFVLGFMAALLAVQPAFATEYRIQVPVVGLAASAAAGPGAISVSPSSVQFPPSVLVGSSAAPASVVVANTGAAAIQNVVVALSDGAAGFSQSNNCSGTLSGYASCVVSVGFAPESVGQKAASLTVSSNASNGLQIIPLSGGGAAAPVTLTISPSATQALGQVDLGKSKTSGQLSLANTSTTTATGLGISVPASYSLSSSTCSTTLAAGASCTFSVTFTPTSTATVSGSIAVTSSGGGAANVPISGTGQALTSTAVLTSAPSISLADWYQSGTITGAFTYRNDGTASMTLASPTLQAPLNVVSNDCSSVAPGASCSIAVALARDAVAGGSSSQVFIPSGADVAPAQASVNWSIYSNIAAWSTTNLDFGTVQVDQTVNASLSLTNSGSVAANFAANSSIANVPSGYSFDLSACSNVAPGGSCAVTASFTPSGVGVMSGAGLYLLSVSAHTNTLSVTGTGAVAAATLSDIAFGSVGAGTTTDLTSTLTNTGTAPLSVTSPTAASVAGDAFAFVGSTCPANLPAGASCATTVRYSANGMAAASGALSIATGAGVKTAALAGQSLQPVLTMRLNPLIASDTAVGAESTLGNQVINNGNTTATNLALSLPDGFRVSGGSCPVTSTVAPGGRCSYLIEFDPTQEKTYSGTATVTSNNASSVSFSISGTGTVEAVATLTSAPSANLADWYRVGGTQTASFTYRNDGNAPMTLSDPGLVSPLSLSSNDCLSVVPGNTCTMSITLALDAMSGGSGQQTFIPAGARYSAQSQNGSNGAVVYWSIFSVIPRWEGTISFTSGVPGQTYTQSINVYNDGSVAADWSTNNAISGLTSEFMADTSQCSNVAPGGGVCSVKISWTPTAVHQDTYLNGLSFDYRSSGSSSFQIYAAFASNFSVVPSGQASLTQVSGAPTSISTIKVAKSKTVIFTLGNLGGGTVPIVQTLTKKGSPPLTFGGTCPGATTTTGTATSNSFGSQQTCTISVLVGPAASTVAALATLVFKINNQSISYEYDLWAQ